MSINRGEDSLYALLKSDGIEDPSQYIRFFSLRTHAQLPNSDYPITEMIYIHSKLMIVDDTYMILGSANINDRSMLGSRDHEIGVVIT
jgi:phospholipase D1/2